MKYWLMKSEPESYSIDRLAKEGKTFWEGVRNYQARNFMMNEMKKGDKVLFYHSNTEEPSVVGLVEICAENAVPDFTSWDKNSRYYDAKSPQEKPRWFMTEVSFVKKFTQPVTLKEIKNMPGLEGMRLVQKGMRLSVQPVTAEEYNIILEMAGEA
jgi:predicted RNA-binding protein with PUA-like domain